MKVTLASLAVFLFIIIILSPWVLIGPYKGIKRLTRITLRGWNGKQ